MRGPERTPKTDASLRGRRCESGAFVRPEPGVAWCGDLHQVGQASDTVDRWMEPPEIGRSSGKAMIGLTRVSDTSARLAVLIDADNARRP
jgi:hypothetical protein